MRRGFRIASVALMIALFVAALVYTPETLAVGPALVVAQAQPAPHGGHGYDAPPAGERVFYLTGIEYKGSTTTDDLAAPDQDPTTLSTGYRYKAPGHDQKTPTKWEVSSYRFEPGALTVRQGEVVKLVVFIVNGDKHSVSLVDPEGKAVASTVIMQRGRQYPLTFTAAKAGTYVLHCHDHHPSMDSYITVLPRP